MTGTQRWGPREGVPAGCWLCILTFVSLNRYPYAWRICLGEREISGKGGWESGKGCCSKICRVFYMISSGSLGVFSSSKHNVINAACYWRKRSPDVTVCPPRIPRATLAGSPSQLVIQEEEMHL